MPIVTLIEDGDTVGEIDTETEVGEYAGDNGIVELVIECMEEDGDFATVTNDGSQDTDGGELLPPSKTVVVDGDRLVEFVTGNLDIAGVEYRIEGD